MAKARSIKPLKRRTKAMIHLLALGSISFALTAHAINPMVKDNYYSEHPKLPDLSDLKANLSSNAFFETFQYADQDEFHNNWISSQLEMKNEDGTSTRAFPGSWKLESPYLVPGFIDDLSLVLGSSQTRSTIARRLDREINLNGEKLVIQYEVKLQKMLECGGAYIKLLKVAEDNLTQYDHSKADHLLVFGPDSCGMYTNEIHLILKRTNPITGDAEDKYLTKAPQSGLDQPVSRLYTLILDSLTQVYEIRLDGEVAKSGSLLEKGAFEPELNPPELIPDPNMSKPKDWDDRVLIVDPTASKPDNWDENEPLWIADSKVVKPAEWDENIPQYIPDPSYSKPESWNEKEDGKWIAPLVSNPSCYTKQGCGQWKPKMIKNTNYKGPWEPPKIANPNYQGEWKAPLIANPSYYEDTSPANIQGANVVSFDIWSSVNDISFDNIYIGDSIEEAELIGNATFLPKLSLEKRELDIEATDASKNVPKPPVSEDTLDSPNLFDRFVENFFKWFDGLDELYKGMLISSVMVVVVALTGMGMIRFMLWAQDDSKYTKPVRRRRLVTKETEILATAKTDATGASTGIEPNSNDLLSKRTIRTEEGSSVVEKPETSILKGETVIKDDSK